MDLNRRAFLGGLGATFAVRSVLAAAKRLRERGAALVFVGKESGLLTPDGASPETAAT